MANKHTPGPWYINGYAYKRSDHSPTGREVYICNEENIDCAGFLINSANLTIAELKSHRRLHDARLIAAAPDMLEALEYIIAWTPDKWSPEKARDLARGAIAKAKGDHNG